MVLPFCDYLTWEKGILMLTPSSDRKDGFVRTSTYYVQHHVIDINAILC
jgi:hypothetical protein